MYFITLLVLSRIKNSGCDNAYSCNCDVYKCTCKVEGVFGTRETTCDKKDIKEFRIKTTKSTTTYSYGVSTYNTYY